MEDKSRWKATLCDSEGQEIVPVCYKCGSKDNVHIFNCLEGETFICHKCCYGKDSCSSTISFDFKHRKKEEAIVPGLLNDFWTIDLRDKKEK